MEQELLSKKELLERYGISYGALYRWKRKGLIPEDWFIKKATVTGQETFFPKAQICERVELILGQKEDITLDELAGHLREKDVLKIQAVQYAILETNGNLSVFPYPKERPASAAEAGINAKPQHLPITIVSDGKINRKNLKMSGKDETWLRSYLADEGVSIREVFLFMVDDQGKVRLHLKHGA